MKANWKVEVKANSQREAVEMLRWLARSIEKSESWGVTCKGHNLMQGENSVVGTLQKEEVQENAVA